MICNGTPQASHSPVLRRCTFQDIQSAGLTCEGFETGTLI
jgi:hypothetical protein